MQPLMSTTLGCPGQVDISTELITDISPIRPGRKLVNSVIVRGRERVINVQEKLVNEDDPTSTGDNRKVIVQETHDNTVERSDSSEWVEVLMSMDGMSEADEKIEGLSRRIPLPVEHVSVLEFWVPKMRVEYESVEIPLYVPKFIEVPYPADLMDEKTFDYAMHFRKHIDNFAEADHASLCEVENVAAAVTASEFSKLLASSNIPEVAEEAWMKGKLRFDYASYDKVLQGPYDVNHIIET
eukprot:GHVH01010781.1.p1 GENE.GHVH01010781.1~~GHVH01010781.1.p1  ORF type:complete len:240 (-),score=36.39 GHVH01010781.1:31-750(-)